MSRVHAMRHDSFCDMTRDMIHLCAMSHSVCIESTGYMVCRAPLIEHRALLILYRALLIEHRALLIEQRALLIEHRALLIEHRALLIEHRALLIEHRVLLILYRALRYCVCMCGVDGLATMRRLPKIPNISGLCCQCTLPK